MTENTKDVWSVIVNIAWFVSACFASAVFIYNQFKKINFSKLKFNMNAIHDKSNLLHHILAIVSNFDKLGGDELKKIANNILNKGIKGISALDTIESKKLNKFIEIMKGTRLKENFNIDDYKRELIETLTRLQSTNTYPNIDV